MTFNVPEDLSGARVVYVNIDTINRNYLAFAELFEKEGGNLELQYQQYQIRVNNYQRRAQALFANNGLDFGNKYGIDSATKEEKWLQSEERSLANVEKRLAAMQEQAMEKNNIITKEVSTYFKQYSEEKGIDYIVGVGGGTLSPILYSNEKLDITADVLKALNDNYLKRKNSLTPAGN